LDYTLNFMVKVVLYIFAVIGLLLSPLAAQAAARDCGAMSGQTMQMTGHIDSNMDCCDHAKSEKSSDKACFNNCMVMCGVNVGSASDGSVILPVLAIEQVTFNDMTPALFAQEPSLVVPPPKSNA
jgi:hypothetical protein